MMDPFEKLSPKSQAYQWLRFGEVKPAGWMRAQMMHDLEGGFLGHLDELVPALIQNDDIYSADRLTKSVNSKDLGVIAIEAGWEAQLLWWNSETQSNWRDGLLRTALLLDHPEYLVKARAYIEDILDSQDEDGYLGIYAPDLRYNFLGENGELWAQATLFRVLLGYYEATGDNRILDAIQRAVAVTRHAYPRGKSHPFSIKNNSAGVCHGLMFTDILDRLYQLTGQVEYLDYALWLYKEYSQGQLMADDIQYSHLVDPTYRFRSHGVHTYEQLRALLTATYAFGNPLLEEALLAYLDKLEGCLTPSGAPIGDEMIAGRSADATNIGYEYCSIHELLDTYTHLLQKTGNLAWADRIEWLLFNAGQGARHPRENAIAYLKTDNSYSMTGSLNLDDPANANNPQTRYKYSPAHQDVAVCCVPNAGRIYPYYVKAMWMKTPHGLLAALYGPCELSTQINGIAIHITEQTSYPFNLEITFTVQVAQPVEFELAFRKPAWASGITIQGVDRWVESDSLILIQKEWQDGDNVTLQFQANVKVNTFRDNEYYLSYGPLLFALPLKGDMLAGRQYPVEGFRDLFYFPEPTDAHYLQLIKGQQFILEQRLPDANHPWESSSTLAGMMINSSTQAQASVSLVPLGGTILRKATFLAHTGGNHPIQDILPH
jgi:uncharacterized protein